MLIKYGKADQRLQTASNASERTVRSFWTVEMFPSDGNADAAENLTRQEVIHMSLLVFHAAKTHGGGEDHQVAEDAEELGQIQEQWEGVFILLFQTRLHLSFTRHGINTKGL